MYKRQVYHCLSAAEAAKQWGIERRAVFRSYQRWVEVGDESQPTRPEDIHIPSPSVGRKPSLLPSEEETICKALEYFADFQTPLYRP